MAQVAATLMPYTSADTDMFLRVREALPSSLCEDILDDLEEVLNLEADLTAHDAKTLARRLHSALRGMLCFVSPSPQHVRYTRALLLEQCPAEKIDAVSYVRRLAVAVLDLADEAAKATLLLQPPQ